MRVVVVGVGNTLRGDDAAGLEAARRLRDLLPPEVRVVQSDGEPSRLLDAWEGADAVVILDAVSSEGSPGAVHRLDASSEPLPARLFGASTHELGVGEAIELARALGRLPERVVVFGVEGADFGARDELSPEAARGVAEAVAAVAKELERET